MRRRGLGSVTPSRLLDAPGGARLKLRWSLPLDQYFFLLPSLSLKARWEHSNWGSPCPAPPPSQLSPPPPSAPCQASSGLRAELHHLNLVRAYVETTPGPNQTRPAGGWCLSALPDPHTLLLPGAWDLASRGSPRVEATKPEVGELKLFLKKTGTSGRL